MITTITGVAGSGKTTYMLNLASKYAKEEDVWVIALTNRGIKMIEEKNGNIKTTTVHSFANRIINYGRGEERFEVADEDEKQIIFNGFFGLNYIPNIKGYECYKLPDGNKVDFIKRKILNVMKKEIKCCKNNDVERIIEETKKEINLSIPTDKIKYILEEYENYLLRNRKVDFDYMLLLACKDIERVEFKEKILAWDEINDSLPLVVELVNRAIKLRKFERFLFNGDPAQTIYDNLLFTNPEEFYKIYENSNEKVLLTKTRRLPINIVRFVNEVYRRIPSRQRIIASIETEKMGGEVYFTDYVGMVKVLPNLISDGNCDVGVVVLSNYKAKQISDMLTENGIPNFCYYEGGIWGWNFEALKIRNFLFRCKYRMFDEDFISDYEIVKNRLPGEYIFYNLEMFDMKKLYDIFSNYINILKILNISERWKKIIFNSIERHNKLFEKNVEILTVHSAKGLEFDTAFSVIEPTRDLINNRLTDEKRFFCRRLVYTAVTRVKSRLFVIGKRSMIYI